MAHTEECLRQQEQAKQAQEAYKAAWPRYCCFCNGEGGYNAETYFDPCPGCLGHGECPRCRELLEYNNDACCEECGWSEAKPDALPTIQCICDAEFP